MKKLSAAMERALGKLTSQWRSSYSLHESRGTLDALVNRGIAERKLEQGYMFFPTISIKYRLKEVK